MDWRSPTLDIAVKVTNLWPNRLIGDELLPCDADYRENGGIVEIPSRLWHDIPSPCGRHTFTTWRLWNRDDRLLPSGLLGPVGIAVESNR